MGTKEFLGWINYYNIEPWGNIVEGYRSASIASSAFNAGLMTVNPQKYNSNKSKLEDFLIGVERDSVKSSTSGNSMKLDKSKQLLAMFKALAAARKKGK